MGDKSPKVLIMCPGDRVNAWYPLFKELAEQKPETQFIITTDNDDKTLISEIKSKLPENAIFLAEKPNALLRKMGLGAFRYIRHSNIAKYLPFDIIHVIGEPSYYMTHQAIQLKQEHTILTCRAAQNIFKKFPYPFSFFEKKSYKHMDCIYYLTDAAKYILEKKGFSGKMVQLYNGYDENFFYYKNLLKTENERIRIGFIGHIAKHKGFDLFLKLLKNYNDNGVEFLIVGNIFNEDYQHDQLLEEFNKINNEYGYTRVTWKKRVPHDQLNKEYWKLDIMVLPSIHYSYAPNSIAKLFPFLKMPWAEQFGRVVVEANACGVVVVGSQSGAIPEVINDDDLIFPENNYDDLEYIIKKLSTNKEYYKLKQKNSLINSKRFKWSIIASKMHNEWNRIKTKQK